MVAVVILAVMAVATLGFVYQARTRSVRLRDQRAALMLAGSRLEEVRSALYTNVDPTANNYNAFYLDRIGGTWHVSTTDPGETMPVGAVRKPIVTTVRFVDADGSGASYDCIRITVSVTYGPDRDDAVTLETIEGS